MTTIADIDSRYYRGFVDEHGRFDAAVRRYLRPDHRVLDAGAGSGRAFTYDYGEWTRAVIGVDLDRAVELRNLERSPMASSTRGSFTRGAVTSMAPAPAMTVLPLAVPLPGVFLARAELPDGHASNRQPPHA